MVTPDEPETPLFREAQCEEARQEFFKTLHAVQAGAGRGHGAIGLGVDVFLLL
jgi:hypothetical protein